MRDKHICSMKVLRQEKGQRPREEEARILSEYQLKVWVNGRPAMEAVCVKEYLEELVLGRLLSEGIIEAMEDVKSLSVSEEEGRACVLLKPGRQYEEERPIKNIEPIEWKEAWIFDLEEEFAMDTPLHRTTKSTHSCFLARDGRTVIQCEDIGRHNAMDKVIGYCLRNGIDLRQSVVYSSGRIPTDMAMKAIRSGIPVLVSKEAPTREAVELARHFGLTLLCNAKNQGFSLYSGKRIQEKDGRVH